MISEAEKNEFRIEAAFQFGFEEYGGLDNQHYQCTESQLLMFAKACERAGRVQAIQMMEEVGTYSTPAEQGVLGVVIHKLSELNQKFDSEIER